MLDVKDEQYLNEVKKFAEEVGFKEQLQEKLDWLDNFRSKDTTVCELYRDLAPRSFFFKIYIKDQQGGFHHLIDGGLIYHGAHDRGGDGGPPTYSVNLNPQKGWQVHT